MSKRRPTDYLTAGIPSFFMLLLIACGGGATLSPLPAESTPLPAPTEVVVSQAQPQELMLTSNHLPQGDPISYSTAPPTSGDHWSDWAKCGIYLEGLPDERIVHNLEHGNIVVSYNFTTEEEVAQLLSVVNGIAQVRNWGVVRFYDRLEPGTVALTAWGMLEIMEATADSDGVDRGRVAAFFDEFSGELGPEKIPC